MKWMPVIAVGCCLVLVGGCGKGLHDPVDPGQASAALETALDAWKQGEDHAGLQQRRPPIYFNEPEWKAGKTLVAYQLGAVSLVGRQARCLVKLSLRDHAGKASERQIAYQIDTVPQIVIAREGLGP